MYKGSSSVVVVYGQILAVRAASHRFTHCLSLNEDYVT